MKGKPSTAPATADPWMKIVSAGKANRWQPPMASSWTTNASLVGAKQHPLQRRLANSGMKSSSAETALWTGRENEMGTRAHRSPSRHPRQRHVPPRQKRHFHPPPVSLPDSISRQNRLFAQKREKHLLCSHRHTTVIAGPTCLIAHLLAPHDRAQSHLLVALRLMMMMFITI